MSKIVANQGQKRGSTYAQSEKGVHAAREELEACTAAGLAVDWVDEADVPFPFSRRRPPGQPGTNASASWGKVFGFNMFQARKTDYAWTYARSRVKPKPNRSYCVAYRLPGNITRGMYVSADSPTRSVRSLPPPTATG
jgi:hypothetical protein